MRALRSVPLLAGSMMACGGQATVNAPMTAATSLYVAPLPAQPIASTEAAAAPTPTAPTVPTSMSVPTALPSAAVLPLAARIESFYAGALPIECDIAIETITKSYNLRRSSRMHLVFERPGRFHVSLSTGEVVVTDAQRETISDPSTRQVYQRPVPADHCPIAFSWARGRGSLNQHLALAGFAGTAMNAPGTDVLLGTPRTPIAAVTRVVFFANASGEVKRTLVVAANGDRERYDTIACTMNATPPTSMFGSIPLPTLIVGAPAIPLSLTTALP